MFFSRKSVRKYIESKVGTFQVERGLSLLLITGA